MRALLVCAAPGPGSPALVALLATRADAVIAVDGGGALCLSAGVTPDLLVGDLDSLCPDDLARLRADGVETLRYPVHKDASDLELALRVAAERGATHVVVTAAFSGRLDHTLASLGVVAAADDLAPTIAEPGLLGWCLSPAGRSSVTIEGSGATVSLMAFGGPAVVSAKGVIWPLAGTRLDPLSSLGLSNRIDGTLPATIEVEQGTVWVLAPFDDHSPGATEVEPTITGRA